jgi:ribosome maturation factor RimP
MALRDQIFELVEPLVTKAGLVLEEVQVQNPRQESVHYQLSRLRNWLESRSSYRCQPFSR